MLHVLSLLQYKEYNIIVSVNQAMYYIFMVMPGLHKL